MPETKTSWAWRTATVFGIGRLQPGPGTYASAVTALLWFIVARALQPALHSMRFGVGTLTPASLAMSICATVILLLSGIFVFQRTERTFIDTV